MTCSDDVLERDRMWCRAIVATQHIDAEKGRLVYDVADLLHHFNEVERSNDANEPSRND